MKMNDICFAITYEVTVIEVFCFFVEGTSKEWCESNKKLDITALSTE